MKRPENLLGSDNYFHWEFNMRMKLARKGLLIHIIKEVKENEMTDSWRVLDLKAFAIIAQGIEVEHQSKIRNAQAAKHAWDYYNRSNIQNRVALTRRLHEFKMEEGSSMSNHLDRFGELVVAMEAVGDPMNDARQLVILLGSLPAQYDTIVTVIENLALDEVKEKLLKQYDKMQQQEPAEGAFKARQRGGRNNRMNNRHHTGDQKNGKPRKFMGTCHSCGKRGHKQHERHSKKKKGTTDENVFMAHATCERVENGGWLIDSGATSHMSPYHEDFVNYHELRTPIEVTIADGKTVKAAGRGDARVNCDGIKITVSEVLHIPGLDRRLLSVPKLTKKGWVTQFTATECTNSKNKRIAARAPLVSNSYVLSGYQERAMQVEYKEANSKWELYHARRVYEYAARDPGTARDQEAK